MQAALDHVSFLARSEHRVTVLELLAGGGQTRAEVREATDIPQATLGRILEDFVDRGWAKTEGRTYSLTPFGAVLAEEFGSLLRTVASMQNVESVARWLPDDAPDPRHFADATVVVPTPGNVMAHVEYAMEMLREAEEVQVVSTSVFPDAFRYHSLQHGDGPPYRKSVGIVGGEALDVLFADPELKWLARTYFVEAEGSEVYRYDGPIDCLLAIVDGTAVLGPLDENGVPRAHVDSTNPVVVEWVEGKIDHYVAAGTRITEADFDES